MNKHYAQTVLVYHAPIRWWDEAVSNEGWGEGEEKGGAKAVHSSRDGGKRGEGGRGHFVLILSPLLLSPLA